MSDVYSACLHVNIADLERAQFGCSQAGVQQRQDDGAITVAGRAVHGELAAIPCFGFLAVLTSLEDCFNLVFGERLDGRHLEARWRNILDGVRPTELGAGPREEGRQRDPHIADRFGREWMVFAGQPMWFVVGA